MIKAFLFDYGGVMTTGGVGDELGERLAGNLGITVEAAGELLLPIWRPFMKGQMSEDEVWQSIEQHYGKAISLEKRNIWDTWDSMQLLPEMVAIVQQLRGDGHIVGLLSNAITSTASDIRRHHGYDGFDFTILSCEVGIAKPEPEIFDIAMQHLPDIQPSEVVFLDDRQNTLVPARALGMSTILVEDQQQAINDIEKLLLAI